MAEALLTMAESGRWLLEGDLSFSSVPAVLKSSAKDFSHGQDIQVDLKGVTRADSAGLALLVEWLRQSERNDRAITFTNVPQQLLAIARLCGLVGILSL